VTVVPNAAAREASHLESIAKLGESHGQEPQPPEAGEEDNSVEHISGLLDAILGEVVSLLSTKEAVRTQTLTTRWRHVWRATPLILDDIDLVDKDLPTSEETLRADNKAPLASSPSSSPRTQTLVAISASGAPPPRQARRRQRVTSLPGAR